MKRLDVNSQAIQILADAPVARGGAWQADDTILFAPNANGPLFRVPANGGQPTVATQLEAGQNDHRAPFILPDGLHFLYYARGDTASPRGTRGSPRWHRDEAAARCGRCRRLRRSGYLLFPRQGELLAQSFDAIRLTLDGEAVRVADSVSVNQGISLASLSASASGPIAYGTASIRQTQFTWFDRSGRRLETLGTPDQASLANPALSPDGTRIAFSRVVGGNWDVWLIDMQGAVSKYTSALGVAWNPVWSRDGQRILDQTSISNIYSRSATDGTPEQPC